MRIGGEMSRFLVSRTILTYNFVKSRDSKLHYADIKEITIKSIKASDYLPVSEIYVCDFVSKPIQMDRVM